MSAPRKQIPTSTKVAEHLGISRWTVSQVLNGRSGVSDKTRKRVLEAMKELGYRPNVLARGLRGGKTGVIGISFQEIESPILTRKVGHLQRSLRAAGQRGILEMNGGSRSAEITTLEHFIDFKVDAIVLFGSRLSPKDHIFEEILRRKLPVLAVDPEKNLPIPTIRLDRAKAMQQCLDYLYELGHRRWAMLGLSSDPIYGTVRMHSLSKAAREFGLVPQKCLVSLGEQKRDLWSYEYGHHLGQIWMALKEPPTAAIALNDRIAIGAMQAIKEAGKRIPEDFSIIGFDNLEIGMWTDPTLTTISQELDLSTRVIVDSLSMMLDDSDELPGSQMIVPTMIVRASTGKAPR